MAKEDPRRTRDAAGVGPYARERERLVPLSELGGWNVMSGEPDIRAWEVKTISGRLLGTVRELLVDAKGGEVVMLDVDLAGSDRHAYVPIRVVEIDRPRRIVRADSADLEEHGPADHPVQTRPTFESPRDVRYAGTPAERVVDRRPIVEETVVRRREAEEPDKRI